jgi:predicted DNA-binding protein (UPF0251 family)
MFIIFAFQSYAYIMPRTKTPRKLSSLPSVKGFKPYGPEVNRQAEAVVLPFEEYEAFKLCDYDQMNHLEAAQIMQVSRPTFTRIYAAARNKIARALAEGRPLKLEGGHGYLENHWMECMQCNCYFNQPQPELRSQSCPLCGHAEIYPLEHSKLESIQNQSI